MTSTITRSARADQISQPGALRSATSLPEVRWALASLALFSIGGALQLGGAPSWCWWAAYLACYATGGWQPGWDGLRALRDRTLDVDVLMVLAAIVAASIGQVLDGGLLIVIFATSGALEALATKRTRDSVTALLSLAPENATLLRDGEEQTVSASDVNAGDEIVVRPGERVGADGIVISGLSDVDESSITGESMPSVKSPGSEVFAGTINGTGALRIAATRPARDSVVARIVAMVEEASATKAAGQLYIERIEQRYSIGMVAATLALFVIPLALGAELEPTLLRAITFMIVASPCAVVLATMPPLLSAMANAGRHGLLLKSAVVMEGLAGVDTVAFDKTGTLTTGRPRVTRFEIVAGSRLSRLDALRLTAAAEHPSQHPLARAVVDAAAAAGCGPLPEATGFASMPGRGVRATVQGHSVEVLSPTGYRGAVADPLAVVEQLVALAEDSGWTAVVLLVDGDAVAVIAAADELRADAAAAVRALRGVLPHAPVLLTGDNARAARALAAEVGIEDVRAELLPAGKVAAVAALQAAGRRVLLVGDGINDAPALATAQIGLAMGRTGSDLALQTSDAVAVRDDLGSIATVIRLSRRARRIVIANLVIAGTVIAVLVTWDLAGTLPLPLGVAGHEGSTVIVGLNGLRLLRRSAWRDAALP